VPQAWVLGAVESNISALKHQRLSEGKRLAVNTKQNHIEDECTPYIIIKMLAVLANIFIKP